MSCELRPLPVTLTGSIVEDRLVMVPVKHDDHDIRMIFESVISDYGLPADRCIIELKDLSGGMTSYASALPLSLAREAVRRYWKVDQAA